MAVTTSALRWLAFAQPPLHGGRRQTAAGPEFVGDAKREQKNGTAKGDIAEQRVENENHGKIDRDPGRVEQRERPLAGEKFTDGAQIAKRAVIGAIAGAQRSLDHHLIDTLMHDAGADPNQNARADDLEDTHDHQKPADQDGEGDQG